MRTQTNREIDPIRKASDEPGESGSKDSKGGDPKKKPPIQSSRGLFWLVTIVLVSILLVMFMNSPGAGDKIDPAQFETLWNNGEIVQDSVEIRENAIVAKRHAAEGPPTLVTIPLNVSSREEFTKQIMRITGNRVMSKPSSQWMPFLITFGPLVLILALLWFFISRGLRSAGAGGGMLGNFGKSRHRTLTKEMTGVTFKDVAGIDEAKDEVSEIIEFLRKPKKFTKIGGRIPRGVLLTGAPGCGKTLLAKAIAGEADVPFFSISGSDFVEMFVGVGASRVRDLFKQAKDTAPCIVFLDEIDAVGRRRGGGFSTGGHDEREQTLNAILVEMDGFNSSDGVIVIAATNRPDVLDPALVRPGRFDRQIAVPLPDVKGRLEILQVHAKRVKLGPDVELERTARGTPMFSGADLAAIINEAAIAATLLNKDFVEQEDLEEARDKVRFGRARKSKVREKDENKLVAYHEAGHAVLQLMLDDADPLHKVTIIPRGDTGGATFSLPEKDRMGYSLKWINATMRILCAGRITEQKAMGDISSGAAQDIMQVTQLARTMIVEWGMSDRLGFVRYAGVDNHELYMAEREFSEESARIIDEEVRRIVDEAYKDAERIVNDNWDKIEAVAQALLRYETLNDSDVETLLAGGTLDKPTVSDLLADVAKKAPPPEPDTDQEPELPPGAVPSPA